MTPVICLTADNHAEPFMVFILRTEWWHIWNCLFTNTDSKMKIVNSISLSCPWIEWEYCKNSLFSHATIIAQRNVTGLHFSAYMTNISSTTYWMVILMQWNDWKHFWLYVCKLYINYLPLSHFFSFGTINYLLIIAFSYKKPGDVIISITV